MPWYCHTCTKRTIWCHWCKVRHCACRPHVPKFNYDRQVVTIRRQDGCTRFMAARRYAHLKGAQRGGRKTAQGPNPGRFNSDTARKAVQARWHGRHRMNKLVGIRLGMARKRTAPTVSRAHLRYLYSRVPRLGIRYFPETIFDKGFWGQYEQTSKNSRFLGIISEKTALRRLGHIAYARKNWVPGENEPIIARSKGTFGIPRAERQGRRKT